MLLTSGFAAALTATALLLGACSGAESFDEPRSLSTVRMDQLPEGLPPAWQAQFEAAFEDAPEMSLLDPAASALVRDRLATVAWIDPRSVRVQSALPDGLRVRYRPRTPRLVVTRNAAPVAVLAADGAVLPEGLPESWQTRYLQVPLEPGAVLPAPGDRVSDPLLQEALEVWEEAVTVAENTGLKIASIERQADYPQEAPGVPPALCFRLQDGREIDWGRAVRSRDPWGVPLERKVLRLRKVLKAYPELAGVHRLRLDHPLLRLYGPDGAELELPPALRDA